MGSAFGCSITLYRVWTVIGLWSGNGTHGVTAWGSAAVKDGLEYRLVASSSIDGVYLPPRKLCDVLVENGF